jgi:hypothetical protein
MPYFYLRHSTFIAVFRTEIVEGKKKIVAELVASQNLRKEIKDKNLKYKEKKIYEEPSNTDNNEPKKKEKKTEEQE